LKDFGQINAALVRKKYRIQTFRYNMQVYFTVYDYCYIGG